MKHLCIFTSRYPTTVDPTSLTFVQQFAWTAANFVEKVSIICPLPINQNGNYKNVPNMLVEKTTVGKEVYVYHPKYFSFGQVNIGPFNTASITTSIYKNVVEKVISSMSEKPNVFYGHFFTPAGVTACMLGEKYGIPAIIAYGESTPWTIHQLGINRTKKMVHNVSGIVSVSSSNKYELVQTGVVSEDKIGVFPNGFLSARFSKKNKIYSRKKFGLADNIFIVAFVGHFIDRKGITILNDVIKNIPDVYLICAGKGEKKPQGSHVLFCESVNPNDLADFYSAADVFVLPTLNEGCCNAIIEAMACGLPIISSNLPFNNDILDNTNSLLVDPLNDEEIKKSILRIKEDNLLREKLSRGSIEKAKKLTLENRTKNIIKFIEDCIE